MSEESNGYPFDYEGDDPNAIADYPDGWTCIVCGDEYYGIMPRVSEGTMCLSCWKET